MTLKWKVEKSLIALVLKNKRIEKNKILNFLIALLKKRKLKNQIKRKKNMQIWKKNLETKIQL
jgi:hypothetical protein